VAALTHGRQNILILVILLAVQLFLASRSARGSHGSTLLERWLMRATSPVVRLSEALGGVISGTSATLQELLTARGRTVVLQADVRRLTAELQRYRETEQENRRLRLLLGMRQDLTPRSIGASVVTSNLSGPTRMIVVDRGTQHGVRPDMPAVAWGGAVGRVIVAARRHSKIRLLTDANSGVAAAVQRSRAQGIVVGRAGGGLDLLYVPRFSDVAHGDRVVTSGLDGIFPRGLGVGRVSSILEAADGTQTIELAPELDYRSLEEVLIVLEPPGGGLLSGPATAETPEPRETEDRR
jgi:rod shape-determining protein MreC